MEGKTKILTKLNAIQKEVVALSKEGTNTAQGYKYLSEAQITAELKPLLEKHGVVFTHSSRITATAPTVSAKQLLTTVEVEYAFTDIESGEAVTGVATGQGSDPNDKGVYKAITGAIKYIFMKTFLIPTGDDPEDDSKEKKGTVPFGKSTNQDED